MAGGQIILPWPPRELSPNARVHHLAKARLTKLYREQAYWLAHPVNITFPADGSEVLVRCDFHPPDRRRRDLDGMFSSIKAGLDGIADSICVNDHRFGFEIHRRQPVKGGLVIVTLEAKP